MSDSSRGSVSFLGAVSIGIGGMVGGGIFAVLGLAAVMAGGATPMAFVVAGAVALLTAYSYAKLSVAYPDNGGTIIFLDRAFGKGWHTGAMNNLLWIGYVITLALYSVAFANYAATFLPSDARGPVANHVLISAGIVLPTLLNFLGSAIVSKAETYVVGIKLLILVAVIAFGAGGIDTSRLEPSTWSSPLAIVGAGMIIFVAYEGFELIANTAANVANPKRTLPRAYYFTVVFVIVLYVLIAAVVVGSLSTGKIASAQDFALAEAAQPSLGKLGFSLVGVAAVLATLSAINSTLYGAARLSYGIAMEGELPQSFEKKFWNEPVGLLITAIAALLLANTVDLTMISTMASASFLIIFMLVNAACFRRAKEAKANRVIAIVGVLACGGALASLTSHTWATAPATVGGMGALIGAAFVFEGIFFARHGSRAEASS